MVKATELTGHTSKVRFMAQSPDGCKVAFAAGNTLRIWNTFGDPEVAKSAPKAALHVHLVIVLEALKKMIHVADMLLLLDLSIQLKVRLQFLWKPYINECKERTACQWDGCSCKNNWGGFECKCKVDRLYIKEQDAYIDFSNWPPSSSHVEPEPEAIADPEPEEMPYCDWLLEEKEMADCHRMRLDQRIADS
ncbi:hypothetical protein Q3G72_020853 [Acer saccharum]|nr:hypothetical protein Q3G72_020853 [Acer saccharum]